MITQHSWMFLSSFEDLRAHLLEVSIVNITETTIWLLIGIMTVQR